LYFLLILLLTVLLNIFAPFILMMFVGKSFQGALPFILWISLSGLATGMYFMVANYIFYVKKTHLLSLAAVFNSLFYLILGYVLVKRNGAIDVAETVAISSFVTFFVVWSMSAAVYPMPWFSFWKRK
jgi:O-antigen/teichoic acid export membrane protein